MKSLTYICFAVLLCISTNDLHATSINNSPETYSEVQRVRIDVTTTMGYTRHLLLGFTPDNAASDGFDYGYDAQNIDNYSNDCNWMIDHNRYVIQGVGSFHESKTYPMGLFLSDTGNVEFSLLSLENFDQNIDVYIYDSLNETVTSISNGNYIEAISEGNYVNRFYITFTNDINAMNFPNNQLSVEETDLKTSDISYLSSTKELKIKGEQVFEIKNLSVYSVLGQKVKNWVNIKSDSSGVLKLSLSNISEGTYIVIAKTEQGKFNKRLLITN